MGFVIHWHESAMELHVFPVLIPHPTSLSTRFLWVFPVYQAQALVSCIPPGLVICFTIDNIHAVLSKHPTLAFSHRVQKIVCLNVGLFGYILFGTLWSFSIQMSLSIPRLGKFLTIFPSNIFPFSLPSISGIPIIWMLVYLMFSHKSLMLCLFIHSFGERNGNPLQYSCLENPMDGGTW